MFLFFIVSAVLARRYRARSVVNTPCPFLLRWVWTTPWIALVVFSAEMGLAQSGRYLASYYPLLLTPFLAGPGFPSLVRCVAWQRWACAMILVTLVLVAFSRQRPLLPMSAIARAAARLAPGNAAIRKVGDSFARSERTAFIEFLSRNLPATETTVGYYALTGTGELDLAGDGYRRRVRLLEATESADWLREHGIRFVFFEEWNPKTPDQPTSGLDWLKRVGGGSEVARMTLPYATGSKADLLLLRIDPKP